MSQLIQKIRPAARHILTIGEGIIKDNYTAILELIKNSYDADATEVFILFNKVFADGKEKMSIIIKDNGHGMNTDTIINNWLVPSTDNKKRNPTSKYLKRNVQGNKGIGRYASSKLGNDFVMVTVDRETKTKSTVVLDWNIFNEKDYLDEVDVMIETEVASEDISGTSIEIKTSLFWEDIEFTNLVTELQKFVLPILVGNEEDRQEKNNFNIYLQINNISFKQDNSFLWDYDTAQLIEPTQIMDHYLYRMHGFIDKEGNDLVASVEYCNNYEKLAQKQSLRFKIDYGDYCGRVEIDIRVFDRDKDGMDILKQRLGIDANLKKMRNLVDDVYGIRVYKEGFRVRPLGDKYDDWLGLDARRVNNPTFHLSVNQIIGIVTVEHESKSHLEEKATREGFKENNYFKTLRNIIIRILMELEERRYKFRVGSKKGGREKLYNDKIEKAKDFQTLTDKIKSLISNLPEEVQDNIINLIEGKAIEVGETLSNAQDVIAIYQQKIMLGKLVSFILHEGRRPVTSLKQESKNLPREVKKLGFELDKISTKDSLEKINEVKEEIVKSSQISLVQSQDLVDLFRKLDPLAAEIRKAPEPLNMILLIEEAFTLFRHTLTEKSIQYSIIGDNTLMVEGWKLDFVNSIFSNLIDNSIYWIDVNKGDTKSITINVERENEMLVIHFKDSGIGITLEDAESRMIFEPGFTKKNDGMGLGLAIAGEATDRNKGTIVALPSESGAYFKLSFPIYQN